MKIRIDRLNDDFHMEATNEEGNTLSMDASPAIGGQHKGMRPTELLLAGVGGCSSIDVLLILKKQKQNVRKFQVEVEGEKEKVEEYSLFRDIVLHFIIDGDVDPVKAEKAIQLSLDRYCSVSKTLEPTAKISYKLTVTNESKA
jgi:putative redox protein